MKKLLCILIFCLVPSLAIGSGVEFYKGSWNEVLEEAGRQSRLVMVDVYTDWCGPCKVMDMEVFTREDVGGFFNDHFVNYKLNAEDDGQRGPELAEKYQVQGYPFFLFIDNDGELVHRGVGGLAAPAFIALGQAALGDAVSLAELQAKYDSRSISNTEWLLYVHMFASSTFDDKQQTAKERQDHFLEAQKKAMEYLGQLTEKELFTQDSFKLLRLYSYQLDRSESAIDFYVQRSANFIQFGDDVDISRNVVALNNMSIERLAQRGDPAYKNHLDDIVGVLRPRYAHFSSDSYDPHFELSYRANALYAISQNNFDRYLELSEQYIADLSGRATSSNYLGIARTLLRESDGHPELLVRSEAYAEKAYQAGPSFTANQYQLSVSLGEIKYLLGDKASAKKHLVEAMAVENKGYVSKDEAQRVSDILQSL